ncbi:MAG: hypothetical protein H6745_26040 [Deltaproteobacteria bacterium]|nr:hypothetical protein [Deltaproteobacteria bacterium]
MALLDPAAATLTMTLVYWGAERAGKKENVVAVHRRYPPERAHPVGALSAPPDQGIQFVADLGRVGPWSVHLRVVAAPGDERGRRAALKDADAVVFVADSAAGREDANAEARVALSRLNAARPDPLPIVFQWNRRDRPRRLDIDALEATLNPSAAPSFSAIARDADGTWETHVAAVRPLLAAARAALESLGLEPEAPASELSLAVRRRRRGRGPNPSLGTTRALTDPGAEPPLVAAGRAAPPPVASAAELAAAGGCAP